MTSAKLSGCTLFRDYKDVINTDNQMVNVLQRLLFSSLEIALKSFIFLYLNHSGWIGLFGVACQPDYKNKTLGQAAGAGTGAGMHAQEQKGQASSPTPAYC